MSGFTIHKSLAYGYTKPAISNTVTTLSKRYEHTLGGSNKFWEIKVVDNGAQRNNGYQFNVETHYGKMGTQGMYSVKDFSSSKACNKFVSDKIQEKLDKGYVEVETGVASAPQVVPVQKALSKADVKHIRAEVADAAKEFNQWMLDGYGVTNGEVILTVIVGGEVIQETIK